MPRKHIFGGRLVQLSEATQVVALLYLSALRTSAMSSGYALATLCIALGSLAADSPAAVASATLDFVTLAVLILPGKEQGLYR